MVVLSGALFNPLPGFKARRLHPFPPNQIAFCCICIFKHVMIFERFQMKSARASKRMDTDLLVKNTIYNMHDHNTRTKLLS